MTLEQTIAINKVDFNAVSTVIAGYVMRDEPVPARLRAKAKELREILRDYNLMLNAQAAAV